MKTDDFGMRLHEFEKLGARLQAAVHEGLARIHHARRTAYLMAQKWVGLRGYHNELIEVLRRSKQSIDEFMDQWFAPVTLIGEEPRDIIACVDSGTTLKEYLAKGCLAFHRKNRLKRDLDNAPLPETPEPRLPIEEQLEVWKARCLAAETQLSELKAEWRSQRNVIAVMERKLTRLHRILDAEQNRMQPLTS